MIISGGGTGGHIFPAISIAETFRKRFPGTEILFTGAENRMEMERVPAAGFKIIGLPVSGFNRRNLFQNVKVLFKLFKSLGMAKKIIRDFKPDAVVGVGGYASGPTLWAATSFRIPTLIQEQNSYAGITNKLLGKRVDKVCVAYEGMQRFFPASKICLTGNPVRNDLEEDALAYFNADIQSKEISIKKEKALAYFNLSPERKTVLVLGGSLGARSINNGILQGLSQLIEAGIQIIWQTGRSYFPSIKRQLDGKDTRNLLWVSDFISCMNTAYAAADLVVSRAGAGTISELCLLKKAAILVPSPNVAEDHQTQNALSIVNRQAAMMIADNATETQLTGCMLNLIQQPRRLILLSENIGRMALHQSADRIVDEIVKLIEKG
jgi:UDP-N-acetylglucosamine--N-acetylmuramyl-(pentapeptide) pyrophosphoryl-undecaprenol N-acetylglucosamine transferase